jgi:transcriptional regulator with XRE-family HTH domain
MLHELNELNRIRLEDDLTYNELASLIGLKDGSSVNRLLREKTGQPAERTLFRIRKFLAARKASKGRKGSKAAA